MKQNEHEKLTIRVNGKYVEVEDMNGITATAKCNPVDKFNIHVGIGIALQRLENKQIKQQKKTNENVLDLLYVGTVSLLMT